MKDITVDLCRTFRPVGQGLFCSEQFRIEGEPNPINVVYDCGCFAPSADVKNRYYFQKTLQEQIVDAFPRNTSIQCVFISHLHYDHISGLRELLKHNVKYLFLPQLSPALILESVLHSKFNASDEECDDTISLMQLLSENSERIRETQIIQISPNNLENNEPLTEVDILSGSLKTNHIHDCRIMIGNYWEYIPFNYYLSDAKSKKILEELQAKSSFTHCFSNGKINFQALASALKDQGAINQCKRIYKSIFPSENEYSMPVYSGPIDYLFWRKYWCEGDRNYCICHRNCHQYWRCCGCLYTGDYCAADAAQYRAMEQFYTHAGVWRKFLTIQVPHHGSWLNHNSDLYKFAVNAIISVGRRNQYHHPAYEVIRDLKEDIGLRCYVMTEIDEKYEEKFQIVVY